MIRTATRQGATFVAALALAAMMMFALAPATASADADAALEEIDDLVHDWQDGILTADEALEFIDDIVHAVPGSERTGVLAEIDHLVHEWEDGHIDAEDAMNQIDALVHGHIDHDDDHAHDDHAHDDDHGHDDDHDAVAPAETGSGGFAANSTGNGQLILGLTLLAGALLGGARVLTSRGRA